MPRPPPPAHGADREYWQIDLTDWFLIAPDGASLKLTAKEYSFLRCLAEAGGNTVPKARLSDELDGPAANLNYNRLDVLLSRLRTKARQTFGRPLPIRAVTAIGFTLTAPCKLV